MGVTSDLEFGFSPDGAYLAWSTIGAASAQGLKVQKIGGPPTLQAVATGVTSWRISGAVHRSCAKCVSRCPAMCGTARP